MGISHKKGIKYPGSIITEPVCIHQGLEDFRTRIPYLGCNDLFHDSLNSFQRVNPEQNVKHQAMCLNVVGEAILLPSPVEELSGEYMVSMGIEKNMAYS